MKQASDHYGSTEVSRPTFPVAGGTVLWNGTVVPYFCRRKREKSMPNRNILYVCSVLEDSVSYGVSVERNRQIFETGHADRYVCHRRTLFSFSVSRGVWRCLFYLKDGKGCAVFVLSNIKSCARHVSGKLV